MIPPRSALFSRVARRELRAAATWLARDNEAAAVALLDATLAAARRIVGRPGLGRARADLAPARYRFWRVAGFPYLLVYNAERRPPHVVRVLHMARDLGPLLAELADPSVDEPPRS